ncbi:MAG: ComEA family DNA-binding protein [Marinifilaceae bacterium]
MFYSDTQRRGLTLLAATIFAIFIIPLFATVDRSTSFMLILPQKEDVIVELNSCDSTELVQVHGIGPYFASRILRYRSQLGGFYTIDQLSELQLNHFTLDSVRHNFILKPELIQKRHIDSLSFKALVRHPYLEYEEVKLLFQAKKTIGSLSISQLRKHKVLTNYRLQQLENYFY